MTSRSDTKSFGRLSSNHIILALVGLGGLASGGGVSAVVGGAGLQAAVQKIGQELQVTRTEILGKLDGIDTRFESNESRLSEQSRKLEELEARLRAVELKVR